LYYVWTLSYSCPEEQYTVACNQLKRWVCHVSINSLLPAVYKFLDPDERLNGRPICLSGSVAFLAVLNTVGLLAASLFRFS
jgi:hypothetical protein